MNKKNRWTLCRMTPFWKSRRPFWKWLKSEWPTIFPIQVLNKEPAYRIWCFYPQVKYFASYLLHYMCRPCLQATQYTLGAAFLFSHNNPWSLVVMCLVQMLLDELKQSNPLNIVWLFSGLKTTTFSYTLWAIYIHLFVPKLLPIILELLVYKLKFGRSTYSKNFCCFGIFTQIYDLHWYPCNKLLT